VRETVRTMLRDHDVYLTDWHNARDVPSPRVASASTSTPST
jgi:poly-beta-hydroxyalkanoate depolymerase